MLRKYLVLGLMSFLINLSVGFNAYAQSFDKEKDAKFAEKLKTNVEKLGTGKDARIEVKLKDGTKLKGFVSQVTEKGFVVVADSTGTETEVPYPNAKQVKGHNLSNGAKFAIAVGIIGAIIIAVLLSRGS